jgi:leucyl-tRNA synthetase
MAMDFNKVAAKWQKLWEEKGIFKVTEDPKKQKYYVLEMYPYPSASFLHMGHVRNYTIGDVYARFRRMQGFNVLYPMGYDSFGLPAETAAKKEGIHPKVYTEKSIAKIKHYQKALGNSYDWSRVIASHEPEYYRWNQYFFIKFFEKGLVYRQKAPVNWCDACQSVLANEEAESQLMQTSFSKTFQRYSGLKR